MSITELKDRINDAIEKSNEDEVIDILTKLWTDIDLTYWSGEGITNW